MVHLRERDPRRSRMMTNLWRLRTPTGVGSLEMR